jgi:2-iminobutanoate/2-iminopropanoate deaminase
MRTCVFFLTFLVSSILCAQTERKIIFTDKAPKPIGPYNQAILAGNTLYVSGQIALKLDGVLDSTSIENETTQVFNNLKAVLEAAKMDLKNVVKSTIYLTNMKDFKKVNDVYAKHFLNVAPARETVEVKSLPKGAHIEISLVAVN